MVYGQNRANKWVTGFDWAKKKPRRVTGAFSLILSLLYRIGHNSYANLKQVYLACFVVDRKNRGLTRFLEVGS
jgi:hypothetical protein